MSISFVIASTIDEASINIESIDFDHEINEFLYKNREYFGKNIDILLKIDPYDDKVFEPEELETLIDACNLIIKKINEIVEISIPKINNAGIINFADELKGACKSAIKNNKTIVSLGD